MDKKKPAEHVSDDDEYERFEDVAPPQNKKEDAKEMLTDDQERRKPQADGTENENEAIPDGSDDPAEDLRRKTKFLENLIPILSSSSGKPQEEEEMEEEEASGSNPEVHRLQRLYLDLLHKLTLSAQNLAETELKLLDKPVFYYSEETKRGERVRPRSYLEEKTGILEEVMEKLRARIEPEPGVDVEMADEENASSLEAMEMTQLEGLYKDLLWNLLHTVHAFVDKELKALLHSSQESANQETPATSRTATPTGLDSTHESFQLDLQNAVKDLIGSPSELSSILAAMNRLSRVMSKELSRVVQQPLLAGSGSSSSLDGWRVAEEPSRNWEMSTAATPPPTLGASPSFSFQKVEKTVIQMLVDGNPTSWSSEVVEQRPGTSTQDTASKRKDKKKNLEEKQRRK